MDNHTATELAYKNGYEQGKKDAVRHGRWEEESQNSAYYGKLVSCSECGAFLDPKKVKAYRFCYNCGAKMRGDSHD